MPRLQRVCALLFLVVLCATASGWAANLVTNPSFAGNLNGWTVAPGTTFDPTVDATGVPGSGSARNTATVAFAGTTVAISQCIATGPGTYRFGGKIYSPPGQGVTANGVIRVLWFSGSDCSGAFLTSTLTTASGSGFVTLSVIATAPPGTTHALVRGENTIGGAGGTHVVHFDDFVLDNGASDIPVASPLALIALAAALCALGAWVLLRR